MEKQIDNNIASVNNNFKFQRRFFFAHYFYKLRILPCRRYQKVFYKIVVTTRNNSVLEVLGFINPFAVPLRLSYRNQTQPTHFSKFIALNRSRVMFWLSKGALTTPTTFVILYQMGLTKTESFFLLDKRRRLLSFSARRKFFDSSNFNFSFQRNLRILK